MDDLPMRARPGGKIYRIALRVIYLHSVIIQYRRAFCARGIMVMMKALRVDAGFRRVSGMTCVSSVFWWILLFAGMTAMAGTAQALQFDVSYPGSLHRKSLQGRLYVILSINDSPQPRFQVNDSVRTAEIFGKQCDHWLPGAQEKLAGSVLGYPIKNLRNVPAGHYDVQAFFNIYTTFHLADGAVVRLPMDRGEGQQWNRKPGNLYSVPRRIDINPRAGGVIHLNLTQVIPPLPALHSTRYLKRFRLKSRLVSRFWGRPMYISGMVLLPHGWHSHPKAHYPLILYEGHFQRNFAIPIPMRSRPPSAKLSGWPAAVALHEYRLYRNWKSGKLPHVLILITDTANPYYDDAYAVNSANIGPYGDAIVHEVIPYVEKKYRGIGQPWARALYGYSTGGWESLALQVFYPDKFNGAWVACPDPVNFHAFMAVNLYRDANAFWRLGPFSRVPRPAARRTDGTVLTTMAREMLRERVLGSKGRSSRQFDAWQAVFGPQGKNGYPAEIWNPLTGKIHHKIAVYWRDHYDLCHYLKTHWHKLGPLLKGKIHLTVGTMDTFYLNNAVRMLQKFLAGTRHPHISGTFEYGARQPHGWWGGSPNTTSAMSALTAPGREIPEMVQHMLATAPPGADTHSWRYGG